MQLFKRNGRPCSVKRLAWVPVLRTVCQRTAPIDPRHTLISIDNIVQRTTIRASGCRPDAAVQSQQKCDLAADPQAETNSIQKNKKKKKNRPNGNRQNSFAYNLVKSSNNGRSVFSSGELRFDNRWPSRVKVATKSNISTEARRKVMDKLVAVVRGTRDALCKSARPVSVGSRALVPGRCWQPEIGHGSVVK